MLNKITLIVILIIASALRFYQLDHRGLFTDEKFTLLNANGIWVNAGNQPEIRNNKYFTPADFWAKKNLKDYFESIANSDFGTHIVYNGILHYWMKIFGNDDFTVRLPGLFFNLLTIVLLFQLSLQVFNSWLAATISGLLLALDPLNIAMSHIARSYTLSFLLMLAATWIFIKILDNRNKNNSNTYWFVTYALLVGLGLLNHYLNFLVPLAHVIAFLFTKNKRKLWLGFIFSGLFNVLLMVYWFTWGGGYTAFDFLKDKNQKHLELAQKTAGTSTETIQLSTPEIVSKKSIALFFDSSIISSDIFNEIRGVKNTLFCLLIYLLLYTYIVFGQKQKYKNLLIIPIIFLLFLVKSNFPGVIVVVFFFSVMGQLIESIINKSQEKYLSRTTLMVGIGMLILPILFVVQDALKNGHTTSLVHRYIGVASPFVILVLGYGIKELISKSWVLFSIFIFVIYFQYRPVKKEIIDFFEDKSSLNAFFDPPRIKNPYSSLAKNIKQNYIKGDTLIIPGGFRYLFEKELPKENFISYIDAQYINLYFSPNDPIVQTIDPKEENKVFLKKADGKKVFLFDFEGIKLRY